LFGLALSASVFPLGAVQVDFDTFPGPDGEFGTADDIVVAPGTEITTQYMSAGVIIENAVASTGEPGLFAIPQGPVGSETNDIIPTTAPNAAAPLDIPGDLSTSSTGFIVFRFFPSASDFSMDFLDIEGSGTPGSGNTYVDVHLSDNSVVKLLVPSGGTGNQQNVAFAAPAGLEIIKLFVSLNDPVLGGESGAVDSLDFTRTGGCWLTSGGFLNAFSSKGRRERHSFGGNVGPPPSGAWEHQDHGHRQNFHSNDAHITECFHDGGNGPGNPKADDNVARFEGTGRLNNVDGFAFEAEVIDRGEPGSDDHYKIKVWRISDGEVFINVSDTLDGGNLQIHPPNPSLF
jgi:hypothetical protein